MANGIPFKATTDKFLAVKNRFHSGQEVTPGIYLEDVSLRPRVQSSPHDFYVAVLS